MDFKLAQSGVADVAPMQDLSEAETMLRRNGRSYIIVRYESIWLLEDGCRRGHEMDMGNVGHRFVGVLPNGHSNCW